MNILNNYILVDAAWNIYIILNYNCIKIVLNFYLFNLSSSSVFDESTLIIPTEASSPKPHLSSLKARTFNISLPAHILICLLNSLLDSMIQISLKFHHSLD